MRSPARTPFAAIFQFEVLFNSKRIVPYALMVLFAATAAFMWFKGPAIDLGWAKNSDFHIVRNLKVFSFLFGLPIFTAVIMGDAVIRDFRLGIDPLIFSKPISRAQYLLGKFFGNFFVLVCCQTVYAVTQMSMQAFPTSRMVVQPVQVLPYFKHFFFFVVLTHLVLAAVYFTVGTLTRNSKIVYGLAVCFYPVYIAYQVLLLKGLPLRWRDALDPFLLEAGSPSHNGFGHSADFLNHFVVSYSADMIANRVVMILIAAVCLTILYFRFAKAERPGKVAESSMLGLSTAAEGVYYYSEKLPETHRAPYEKAESHEKVILPVVTRVSDGFRAALKKLIAALAVEFQLLRTERSLVVLVPLAVFLSTLDLAFFQVVPQFSYSATYASGTARALLLFLFGMTVFCTGEAMHRDREARIEPILWATPAPNNVLLLSKFLGTLLLMISLIVLVGLSAIVIQLLRGHTPVDISAYLITYLVILLPSIVLMTAVSIVLNLLLRNKYLAYVIGIGIGSVLFYLYSVGYNHWLYNPVLYQLWNYADLTGAGTNQATILVHRIYCLAIAGLCLALAHLFFQRKSTKGLRVDNRLTGPGWAIAVALVSVAIAAFTGWSISSSVH